MPPTRPLALAAAIAALLLGYEGRVLGVESFGLGDINNPLAVGNAAPNWGTPDSAATLFFWGTTGSPTNSVREFQYTPGAGNTTAFRLTQITFEGTVQSSWKPNGEPSDPFDPYFLSQYVTMGDPYLQVQLSRTSTSNQSGGSDFGGDPTQQIIDPTPLSGSFSLSDTGQITDRVITPNSVFSLGLAAPFLFDVDTVPFLYMPNSGVSVTFEGTQLSTGTLTVTPTSAGQPLLNLVTRAGADSTHGGTATAQATISNTGAQDSVVYGTVGAAVNDSGSSGFSGTGAYVALDNTTAAATSKQVSYGFEGRASLSGGTVAIIDTGTAAIATNAANQTLGLRGATVGPVFDLKYDDTSVTPGTNINVGNVLVSQSGTGTFGVDIYNQFNSQTTAYTDAQTGLTVRNVVVGGAGLSLTSTMPLAVISDDGNHRAVNFSLNQTGAFSGTAQFSTDVNAAGGLGAAGLAYDYTLSGTGFLASLSTKSTTTDFGYVRIAGSATAKTQTVQVTNNTGGGLALHGITMGGPTGTAFSTASEPPPNPASIGDVADGSDGGRRYTVTAAKTIGPVTSAQTLGGTIQISGTEITTYSSGLSAKAVGPVFNFSGSDVSFDGGGNSYQDHGTCNETQSCSGGTLNLGTLSLGTPSRLLTIANLFGYESGIGTVADLTLGNLGFWNGSSLSDTFAVVGSKGSAGLFSILGKPAPNTALSPLNDTNPGRSNATTFTIKFSTSATEPETFTLAGAPLWFFTDVRSILGNATEPLGTTFKFAVNGSFQITAAPVPPSLALVGLGLAALARARRRARPG